MCQAPQIAKPDPTIAINGADLCAGFECAGFPVHNRKERQPATSFMQWRAKLEAKETSAMSRVTDSVYPVSALEWKWNRSGPRDWAALRRGSPSALCLWVAEKGERWRMD
jgi:hypothetical protein